MSRDPQVISGAHAAAIGHLALASAMGIGRFAFTPLMPLMQHSGGLSLAQGGWLASANYAGYLAGALACFVFDTRPRSVARAGLAAVALTTLAMGLDWPFSAWLVLRFLAGAASAFVFVGVSAWTLSVLAPAQRTLRSGQIYAGVGLGIALAGLIALIAAARGHGASTAWYVLGALACAVTLVAWRPLAAGDEAAPSESGQAGTPDAGRLVLCYGVLGFGYIIPATFLPAFARSLIDDPLVFGWTWPAFGVAAALSTLVAAPLFRGVPPRRLWAMGQVLMALGVAAPAVHMSLATLLFAAVVVGSTFMVITMAGMQEARRMSGPGSAKLMAAMTAAFAIGQIVGPLLVRTGPSVREAMALPSVLAAVLLIASGAALLMPPSTKARAAA